MKGLLLDDGPWEGYRVYRVFHKRGGRWYAVLYKSESDRTTLQYAKFVLSYRLGRRIGRHETVDHIDGDKTNDGAHNLQVLTLPANVRKAAAGRERKHDLPTGVAPNGRGFKAVITIDGKRFHLGTWTTPTEASSAYQSRLMRGGLVV